MVWLGLMSILRNASPTQGRTAPQRLSSEMAAAATRRRGRRCRSDRCAQRPMRGAARAAAAILAPFRARSVGCFSPGVKLAGIGASSASFSLYSVLIKKYKHG